MVNSFTLSDDYVNLPGNVQVQFVPVAGVSSVPDHSSGVISDDIGLMPGYSWMSGEFFLGSSSYGGDKRRAAQGDFCDLSVGGFYPRITPASTWNFNEMQDQGYLVLARDHNGFRRLLGSLNSPAYFDFSEATQTLGSATRNGYNISFSAKSKKPAFFYQATADTPEAGTVTIYEPDGVTVYTTVSCGDSFIIPEATMLHRGVVSAGASTYTHADLIGRGSTDNPYNCEFFLGKLALDYAHPDSAQNDITAYNPVTGQLTFRAAIPASTVLKAIIKSL